MRQPPTPQKPLKARNAPSVPIHPCHVAPVWVGKVTGQLGAVGQQAALYLMPVKLVANTRPTLLVEKPCTRLLKVSIAQKRKTVNERGGGCIFEDVQSAAAVLAYITVGLI